MRITRELAEKRRICLEENFFQKYEIEKQLISKAILLEILAIVAKTAYKFQMFYKNGEYHVWCDVTATHGFTYGCIFLENTILRIATNEDMVKKIKNKIQKLFFDRQIGLFEK